MNPLPDTEKVLRITLLTLLGLVLLLVILVTVLLVVLELLRWRAGARAQAAYRCAGPSEKVALLHRRLFRLLDIWGVDACLGWNTDRADAEMAQRFDGVAEGDYRRTAALMEKTLYGGIEPEPYEMRTMEALVDKVSAAQPRDLWERLRLRYSRLSQQQRVLPRRTPAAQQA